MYCLPNIAANLGMMVHDRIVKIESLEVVKTCSPDISRHWRLELGTKLSKLQGEMIHKTPFLSKNLVKDFWPVCALNI